MVSIIKGYKCILAVSSKSSPDKSDMLRTMGAEVYVCPAHVPAEDPKSYYEVAKRLHKEIEGSIYINQYFNELNVEAHYNSTGAEIWNQTEGKITHLVACSGTGGTISGTAKYLKEKNPNEKILDVALNKEIKRVTSFIDTQKKELDKLQKLIQKFSKKTKKTKKKVAKKKESGQKKRK
jgi:cystathionine beta-synthase